jgi:hypothetical protein
MQRWTEPPVGESLLDVVLSIHEQTVRLHNDRAVLANYSDAKGTLRNFDEIGRKLDELDTGLRSLGGHPGSYLRAMAKAFRCQARNLQGDVIPYEILLADIQELPSSLIPETRLAQQKEKAETGMRRLGYHGSYKEMAQTWLSETRIQPDQVTQVARSLITLAKQATLERVIGLPEADGINEIKSIQGVFWSGYSKYLGGYRGDLTFNIDRPWSEPTFAQVLTHEAYPGHQAFYCRWDHLFQSGLWPIEAAYYMVNTPTNSLFEGGPEMALHFLGWDREEGGGLEIPAEARMRYAVARDLLDYQRMAQTNACLLTNVHGAGETAALNYMTEVGGMTEIEARNSYRFFTHPIQRTYYPTYYYGRWLVGLSYALIDPANRAAYFKLLYDTPQTNSTFIEAIKGLTGQDFDPFSELI